MPCRILDALAVIHGIERPGSESEVLAGSYDPWLKVGNAAPERRQAQFEDFVRGWRTHGEEVRSLPFVNEFFTGAWAFEAVVLARVFDLDDAVVREVPEYPVDLADFSRDAGVPRLADRVTLPGPWKEPAAPKVREPEEAREPVAVSGEPTLADVAALLTPVGAERLDVADADALLDAGVKSAAVLVVDPRTLDPADTGALLQLACRDLGLRAPGGVPGRLPQDSAKALPKFDAWLQKVGVRLLGPDVESSDLLVFPVLEADHITFAGRTVAGLRLRTMDQLAANET